jgi:hypothetical protein
MTLDEIKNEVKTVVTDKEGVKKSITPTTLGGLLTDMCDFSASATPLDIVADTAVIHDISATTIGGKSVSKLVVSGQVNTIVSHLVEQINQLAVEVAEYEEKINGSRIITIEFSSNPGTQEYIDIQLPLEKYFNLKFDNITYKGERVILESAADISEITFRPDVLTGNSEWIFDLIVSIELPKSCGRIYWYDDSMLHTPHNLEHLYFNATSTVTLASNGEISDTNSVGNITIHPAIPEHYIENYSGWGMLASMGRVIIEGI